MENTYTTFADQKLLREELCNWLASGDYSHAITLNADRTVTAARMKGIFGLFCGKIDKVVLGRNARNLQSNERFRAVAFPEHLTTNGHLHAVADFRPLQGIVGTQLAMEEAIERAWKIATKNSGSIFLEPYRDIDWNRYMTKDFVRTDNGYFLAADFHPDRLLTISA